MKNRKGFSLVELLIVVTIIGVIAAIAIPNLLASRRSANEGSAISSLRLITGAQATYRSSYGGGFFAQNMSDLASKNIIDSSLGCPTDPCAKSGYNIEVDADDAVGQTYAPHWNGYAVPTVPTGPNSTGDRGYYTNEIGVIYRKDGGSAPTAGVSPSVRLPTDGTPIGN